MTPEERFERIEATLQRLAEADERANRKFDRRDEFDEQLRTAHMELEAAQLNQQKTHTRLEEALAAFVDETRERIANLTILVDRLVEHDLGRSGGETV
jgi:hypothetical protein